jgi:predicted permease
MRFSLRGPGVLELRLAVRTLRKQPVVTIATILALAAGMGMAATGFTLLDAVLYSKLPYPVADRFVMLDVRTDPEARRTSLSFEKFQYLAANGRTLEHLGAARSAQFNLQLPNSEIVPVDGAFMTPDSTSVFQHAPIAGRTLQRDDGMAGAPAVAIVRESLWRRHFSGDPAIVGGSVTVSGVRRTVVGVVPDDFKFPGAGEIWVPLGSDADARENDWPAARTYGVVRAGTEIAVANAELAALAAQFDSSVPGAERQRVTAMTFTQAMSSGLGLLSALLVSCLVAVLLVIAANVGNLVLARTLARARELALHTALGASRGRLVTGVFVEVLVLGAVSAAAGLITSQAVLAWVRQTLTDLPFWVDFTASPRTMLFVVGTTLLAVTVAGVIPALRATRRDTAGILMAGTRQASAGFGVASGVMVAVQMALSIALLNGALIMARGVAGYMSPSLPVPAREVLTARIYSQHAAAAAVIDAVAAMPGVIAAGAATSLPGLSPPLQMIEVEATDGEPQSAVKPAPVVEADRGFFAALGGEARAGRLFSAPDFTANAPAVAIVNQPFVAKFFAGANPVGRRLRVIPSEPGQAAEPWREIIGVVPDLGLSAGDETMAAGLYLPLRAETVFHVALRASPDRQRLDSALRTAIARVDPAIQVREIVPLADVGREDRAVFAGIGAALAGLGGMALLLSLMATYAILSLSVTRRTREIGIRAALGASRIHILTSVMGRTCVAPALGAIAGIGLGVVLAEARGIFAFRLPATSGPWGLTSIAVLMIAAGLIAAWVPARRALAVAPADALRAE